MEQNLLEKIKNYAALHKVPILLEPSTLVLTQAVRNKRPRRVLEVGTAIGYSSLLIAAEMQPGGKLTSIDTDKGRQEIAAGFIHQAPLDVAIELLTGDANEVICKLDGKFDFIFLDAAKGQYVKYLTALLPLLQTGAVIVADNVLFRGWVEGCSPPPRRYRTIVKRLQEYLALVRNPGQFQTRLYHVGDGLTVSTYLGPVHGADFVCEGDDVENDNE